MGWKRTVLNDWNQNAIADSDTTKQIVLPKTIIGAIYLRLSGTGGAGTPAVTNMIATMKVKCDKGYIVDLDSADAIVLAGAITGRKPTVTNATGAYTETNQSIYWGRFPRDRALMKDFRSESTRLLELTFGTLIAATAWATTTVRLTIVIDEWIGELPANWKGYLSSKTVEGAAKATGTGKVNFELFKDHRLAALLINVGTITTIDDVEITDKAGTVSFGKVKFRDLLNIFNHETNIETVETLYTLWAFYGKHLDVEALPNLTMADPLLILDRGTTTSTSKVIQRELYN